MKRFIQIKTTEAAFIFTSSRHWISNQATQKTSISKDDSQKRNRVVQFNSGHYPDISNLVSTGKKTGTYVFKQMRRQ